MRTVFARRLFPLAAALALLLGVAQGVHAQCAQPAANCQGFNTAAPLAAVGVNGAGNADVNFSLVADDFFVGSNGPLASVCFWGRYRIPAGSGSTDQSALTETFRLSYYGSNAAGTAPDTSALLARFTLGGPAPTAGTTLIRTGTVANAPLVAATSTVAGTGPGYGYTASHPPVNVAPGQKVWIEIAGASAAADGSNRFRWLFNNDPALAPGATPTLAVTLAGTPYDPVNTTAGTMAFCVDSGITTNPLPLAGNALCVGAQGITIGAAATFNASAQRGSIENTPFCKGRIVNGPTLWYTFIGDGTTLTASTCSASTTFDTVINVYCGSCAAGPAALNCVASNDSGPPSCLGAPGSDPSRISFIATSGVRYYLAVFGYEGDSGSFALSLTSDSTPAASQPPCGSDRCPLTALVAGVPLANTEADACGNDTNVNCNAPGTRTFSLGANYTGTIANTDLDYWELASPLSANSWVRARLNVEFPALFIARTGVCVGPPLNGQFTNLGAQFIDTAYCPTSDYFVQADTTGRLRLLLAANTRSVGLSCGTGNAYVFRVDPAVIGACCAPAQACAVVPQSVCLDLGGTYLGDARACVASSGSVPDSCAPALCCRGATCAVVAQAFLCTPDQGAGARAILGVCNASGNVTTPCCHADFDKSGIKDVADIFAYLSAWFANSPYADVGGNGTGTRDVTDIFQFLSAWFAGCV